MTSCRQMVHMPVRFAADNVAISRSSFRTQKSSALSSRRSLHRDGARRPLRDTFAARGGKPAGCRQLNRPSPPVLPCAHAHAHHGTPHRPEAGSTAAADDDRPAAAASRAGSPSPSTPSPADTAMRMRNESKIRAQKSCPRRQRAAGRDLQNFAPKILHFSRPKSFDFALKNPAPAGSGRLDEISVSVYVVAPNVSRAIAFSETRTRCPGPGPVR